MEALSEREQEVARLVAAGLANKVIARRLGIALGTVKAHLHNIYSRLNVGSRVAMIVALRQ